MMRLGCAATELLLERKSPPLSHAERLRVESHLAECEDCRREHVAMLALVELVNHKVETSAKHSVQERAIARALLKGKQADERDVSAATTGGGLARSRLAWSLALAAAVLLLAVGLSRRFESGTESPARSGSLAHDRVKAGVLVLDGQRLVAGDGIPDGRELRASGAVELSLAHATLAIEKMESLRWSATKRSVELRQATLEVEVDPTPHQSFQVVTPNFVVEVLGTHFRVALDTVTVQRGRVRVQSREGSPLAELGPGQGWTFRQLPQVSAAPVANLDALDAPVPSKPEPAPPGANVKERAPVLSAAELLARARHRLAGGDAKGARSDLETLLASGASPAQQAEAYMLKGDSALVEGDATGAVRQYLDVRQRFAGSRAAETALFAAARVESNRGSKAAAKKLLLEYRERYPKGQFRPDVDARLKMLE